MRWILLALLLIATPAHALIGSTGRLAVFFEGAQTYTSVQNVEYAQNLAVLQRSNPSMDFYVADARTWGQASVADSTWFRQRYDAVLILHQSGQAGGTPVVSTVWSSNFQDAAAATGIVKGPMGGRWPIPVFSIIPDRLVPTTTSYNDTTAGNVFVAGILNASPAGTFASHGAALSLADGGTWRFKRLARLRGSTIDTLYAGSGVMGCVPATWSGPGTTAALVWADTTFGGAGRCAAGDTAAAVWRYRPRDDLPGIYYLAFSNQDGTGNTLNSVMALQFIYTLTPIKPGNLIEIPLMLHNPETAAVTNTTYETNAQAVFDSAYAWGLKWNLMTHTHPTNYGTDWNATSLARLREAVNRYRWAWHPFSSNAGWTHEFFTPSDTAGFRTRWNQLHNTATHADSFNLPVTRLADRIVTAGGICGVWLGSTLKDSGVNIVETTITTPHASGWAFQAAPNGGATLYGIPCDGSSRTMRVEFAYGLPHDTTFTKLSTAAGPGNNFDEYVGRYWMESLWHATRTKESLYFHGGGSTGVFRMDPYYSWLISVLGRHFRMFNKVIKPADWP